MGMILTRETAIDLLNSKGVQLSQLYETADRVRREHMGDEVFVRGIIEFSNVCANDCHYCGIRGGNRKV
jgi:biotin synthase